MATLWEIITDNSSLPIQAGTDFWDHLNNQQGGFASIPIHGVDVGVTTPLELVEVTADSSLAMVAVIADTALLPVYPVGDLPIDPILIDSDLPIDAIIPCECVDAPPALIPAPDPLAVFVISPDEITDVCGALIAMQAEVTVNPNDLRNVDIVNDPVYEDTPAYVHAYEWEQTVGTTVELTLTNNNRTAAYVRAIFERTAFTFYADRGTAWEVSVSFSVVDYIRAANVTGYLTNTARHVTRGSSGGNIDLRLALRAVSLESGDQPAELWWEVNPNDLRSSETLLSFGDEFVRFELVADNGVIVSLHYDFSAFYTATPPAGQYYLVRAVFNNRVVTSNRVFMSATRNVTSDVKHALTMVAFVGQAYDTANIARVITRKVPVSVKKVILEPTVLALTDTLTPYGIKGAVVSRYDGITKDAITVGSFALASASLPPLPIKVTRSNGSNIGG